MKGRWYSFSVESAHAKLRISARERGVLSGWFGGIKVRYAGKGGTGEIGGLVVGSRVIRVENTASNGSRGFPCRGCRGFLVPIAVSGLGHISR